MSFLSGIGKQSLCQGNTLYISFSFLLKSFFLLQVVYILDQVRALERELQARLEAAGLEDVHPDIVVVTRLIPEAHGTTCNERLEAISGTSHARILRVPFRDREGRILRKWISRFDVWPYLERFTIDSTKEILAELGGKPQFVIGNYSGK